MHAQRVRSCVLILQKPITPFSTQLSAESAKCQCSNAGLQSVQLRECRKATSMLFTFAQPWIALLERKTMRSSETTAAWFLGRTHKPISRCLWLLRIAIVGLFQASLEAPGTRWHDYTPALRAAGDDRICWTTTRIQVVFQDPDNIPNMLQTARILILLFSSARSVTRSTFSSLLLSMHVLSVPDLRLRAHRFSTLFPSSSLQKILSTHNFRSICLKFKATSGTDKLFFQVRHFPGKPKLQREQHACVTNKTLLNYRTCCSLIPSRVWLNKHLSTWTQKLALAALVSSDASLENIWSHHVSQKPYFAHDHTFSNKAMSTLT